MSKLLIEFVINNRSFNRIKRIQQQDGNLNNFVQDDEQKLAHNSPSR